MYLPSYDLSYQERVSLYLTNYSQKVEIVTSPTKSVWYCYTCEHYPTLDIKESFGLIHITDLGFSFVFIILQLLK